MTKQYSVTRMIDAPRDRVWELLTDVTSYRGWNPAVVSIKARSWGHKRTRVGRKPEANLSSKSLRWGHPYGWSGQTGCWACSR